MLSVFAERLESDHGPKEVVSSIRLFAKDRTIRRAEHRDHTIADDKRMERHKTLFAMLPSTDATDRLKAAMLQRAYDLLWDGDFSGSDALTEFLPSNDVDKMFQCWSDDQDGKNPKSKFYEAEEL